MFIRQCNYKQTTKKCGRLPEQAKAQQSFPYMLPSEDNNLIRKNFLHRMLFRDIY